MAKKKKKKGTKVLGFNYKGVEREVRTITGKSGAPLFFVAKAGRKTGRKVTRRVRRTIR